jgi:NADH:ubiquinone oxidoreductase subunit D
MTYLITSQTSTQPLQSKVALCKWNNLELLPADEEGHMVSADIVVVINSILNDLLFLVHNHHSYLEATKK